jgi:two-component system, NarL family, sensor kinase
VTATPDGRSAAVSPEAQPELYGIVLEHAYRGVRLQLALRGALAVFVVLTLLLEPPDNAVATGWCAGLAAAYAIWAVGLARWTSRGGEAPVRFIWLALFVDLALLASLTLIAGVTSEQSWTADILVNGFFLIPVLAATQLRPGICAAVAIPTVVVYFAASAATKEANKEPWNSIMLRTLVIAAVAVGCIGLSRIQRSRVRTIATLFQDRANLLGELVTTEDRERQVLAEHLHDGALQYVLAARHDLEDAREFGEAESFVRLEAALTETSKLLRSTVSELHPAVIAHTGLARALAEVLQSAQGRAGFAADLDVEGWPDALRTSADTLLFSTARELLANVMKHADADTVQVTLRVNADHSVATLVVRDDGRGVPPDAEDDSLRRGHIGLASHRLKLVAAGGSLVLTAQQPHGTVATAEVPITETH